MKEGDLLLLKLKEIRTQERLEHILNILDLRKGFALAEYKPDLLDSMSYGQANKN